MELCYQKWLGQGKLLKLAQNKKRDSLIFLKAQVISIYLQQLKQFMIYSMGL